MKFFLWLALLSLALISCNCSDDDVIGNLNQLGKWQGIRIVTTTDSSSVIAVDTFAVEIELKKDGTGFVVYIDEEREITKWSVSKSEERIDWDEVPPNGWEISQVFLIEINEPQKQVWAIGEAFLNSNIKIVTRWILEKIE